MRFLLSFTQTHFIVNVYITGYVSRQCKHNKQGQFLLILTTPCTINHIPSVKRFLLNTSAQQGMYSIYTKTLGNDQQLKRAG